MFAKSRIWKRTLLAFFAVILGTTDTASSLAAKKDSAPAPHLSQALEKAPHDGDKAPLEKKLKEISKQTQTFAELKRSEDTDKRGHRRQNQRHTQVQRPVSWVKLQQLYPGAFYIGGPRKPRRVSLTFDDVPDMNYTPKVLDILAKYKVRATFFVVGSRARAYPSVVQRMQREGHMIGNHSYNHPVFSRISLQQFQRQVMRTDAILRPLIGYSPKLIRPPYGEILPKQIKWAQNNGFVIVNWNVDSEDWRSLGSNDILINIKRTLQPGSIILQHAGGGPGQDLSGTVHALPRLIRMLRSKGYQIVTLPELLNRPVARQIYR